MAWFGYLSSTGVYGDWQGEWVDESSPCRQTSSKAIIRQEAESAWLQMYEQYGLPVHVFRLGGIYGPGRSVLDALASKPADLSSSQQRRGRQRFTARCHVYDICAVLSASISNPRPGTVYNVVDDDPAPRTDVMSYARSLVTPASAPVMHRSDGPGANPPGRGSDSNSGGNGGSVSGGEPAATLTAVAQASDSCASTSAPGKSKSSTDYAPVDTTTAAAATANATGTVACPPTAADDDSAYGGQGKGAGAAAPGSRDRAGRAAAGAVGAEPLEEKRVRNDRILGELGVQLRYPTYREGVAAIHAGDCWPLSPEDLRLLQL